MTPEVSGQDITEGDACVKPRDRESSQSEERLQLLWSLWQAQQALQQEEDLLHQATVVQEELWKQCDALRHEIHEAEAEMHVDSPSSGRPASHASDEEDNELRTALLQHEKLMHALHQAEEQLKAQAKTQHMLKDAPEASVDHEEAELLSWRRRAKAAKQARLKRRDELHKELQLQEARGRDERWHMREELTEACVETELLHSEISTERARREQTLRRLRTEEQVLVEEMSEASRELEVASRSSYWSNHSECSDWSEIALARATLEPVDISTPREVLSSPESQGTSSSLLTELRGSRRGRTRASLAGYHAGVAAASPRPSPGAQDTESTPRRDAMRRARRSIAAFRALEKAEGEGAAGHGGRLSVIEEAQPEARQRTPLASLGQALAHLESSGSEGTNARPESPAEKCHGVLEWAIQGEDDHSTPSWAGPGLFEVLPQRVFRLSALFATSEELTIPLRAISSVREYKQDPLGMVFFVRYKAAGERAQVLFRAASIDSRKTWVSNLCEAIREARGGR